MQNTHIVWPGWDTVGLIGRGSFGEVYKIQRDVFGDVEQAALKVISIPQNTADIDEMYNDGYDDESITSTFQSHLKSIVGEYSLMRKMNGSSNIVNCDDIQYAQHADGMGWDIFIKMELLTPLAKSLPADIPEDTVVNVAKDMCAALELCKKHGIIHRDIKPQNIFVSPNGDYKLGDFGIAKTVEKTMGGTKIGTYKYMAPEVYNNQPYGTAADIYSLGLVLYWMLNERRMPFLPLPPEKLKAGMEEEARNRRLAGEPLPPPAHGSEKLKNIVLKACAYDPKDRYSSAADILEDLDKIFGAASAQRKKTEEHLQREKEEQERRKREEEEKARAEQERKQRKAEAKARFERERAERMQKETEEAAQKQMEQPPKWAAKKQRILWGSATVVLLVVLLLCVLPIGKNNEGQPALEGSTADTVAIDEIVTGELPNDDVTEPFDFFSHLTKNGSAGFTGNASIDVHYYDGNYYYVPASSRNRIARASTSGNSSEILYMSDANDAHIHDLCIIDDYIFFMEGSCAISAIDLRTNESKQILTVDGYNKWFHTKCYYSEGWIYTSLTVKEQEQYNVSTIRFDPEDPTIIETLFEGHITGMDVSNNRIFYNYSAWNSGEISSYIYHMETGESEDLDGDLLYYSPMIVCDGVAYAHACHESRGWGLYSIDAAGVITKIPCAAAQHTVVDGKLYYRKLNKGFFVSDLTDMKEHELSVDTLPINFISGDQLAMVPVSDQVIAFLGDDGLEGSYENSGIYLYDILSGEQYKLD